LTEGVYSNGLPHPSRRMRLRIATELGGVVVLTIAFLVFCELWMPNWLNTGTYVGLALVALGPILFKRHEIEEKIWGPPESPEFDRIRRCTLGMFALTVPPVVLFFIIGFAARHWLPWLQPWLFQGQPPCDMISVHFFITLFFYVLWALLQQTLFQFYLLGRLRALLPYARPMLLSVVVGIAYGLVHLPEGGRITVVTIIGGIFWSYSYYRDRYVLPLAISHMLLATTFFYWVLGQDFAGSLVRQFYK